VSETTVIACDVGNSRLKMLIGDSVHYFEYSDDWLDDVSSVVATFDDEFTICGISSVNDDESKLLQQCLRMMSFQCFEITYKHIQPYVTTDRITGTGLDRLLGAVGASRFTEPPYFTIDFGTAITVNMVTSQREFIGGTIMPGLSTQLAALQEHTDKLPLVSLRNIQSAVGTTTDDAILSGVVHGVVGAVSNIITKAQKEHRNLRNAQVLFCGGDAEFIAPYFPDGYAILNPLLVLRGIEKITSDIYLGQL